jgi:uncharacterized lipoprotein
MRFALPVVALACLTVVAGCGTCVTVEGTYDEVWQATREALLAQTEMQAADPVESRGRGTFEATIRRWSQGDEIEYRAEIRPVGSEERTKHKVCVWVCEVDNVIVDGVRGDETERLQSRRRRDLEPAITRSLERALGGGEDAE